MRFSPVNSLLSPVATNLSEIKVCASATADNRLYKASGGRGPQIVFLIAGMWKVLRLLSAPGELLCCLLSKWFYWRSMRGEQFSSLLRRCVGDSPPVVALG